MPTSVRIAANRFKLDAFTSWNPATNTFDQTYQGSGRKNRADRFVSLWPRSSRRTHLFLKPEYVDTEFYVLRHTQSAETYLISETREVEYWDGKPTAYDMILRAHKVTPPSGGQMQHWPVRVQGSGDDLGPVVIGTPVIGWGDLEMRSATAPDGSEEVMIGDYYIFFSRNLEAIEGDFFFLNGKYYRIQEEYGDAGFRASRVSQHEPRFQTATFELRSDDPSIFDPVTGTMTGAPTKYREVSVLVGEQTIVGDTPDHGTRQTAVLFIYRQHIGFVPYLGQFLSLAGVRYRVRHVSKQVENLQWRLEVEP